MQGTLISGGANAAWTYDDPDPNGDQYPGGPGLVSTASITSRFIASGGGGGGVPTSRTITAASPLTGGGDLSTNRAIGLNRAALGAGPVPNDLSTATATNGNGSASVVSANAILSYTDVQDGGYGPGIWTGPRVRLLGAFPFGGGARFQCRVLSLIGDNTTYLRIGFVDETANAFYGFRIRASDGACTAYLTGGALASSVTPLALDGSGYLACERQGASSVWYRGDGTPTVPPGPLDWAPFISFANTDVVTPTFVMGLAKSNNGIAGSASVGGIILTSL